jgi:polysaccharide deacetylase family protein (PEP-CTERM system associated)
MHNALTIDVEDYFQVHAFSHIVAPEKWETFESRVECNTRRILDLLASPLNPRTKVTATFFCLGWVAERYPHLIKEIQDQGHEIACHGYAHQLIYRQSKKEFKEDIHKAKSILEDITGHGVIGYRAPSYSITQESKWVFEVLAEEGFKYDSSIFPIQHDFYGMPDAPRFPFLVSLNGTGIPEFKSLEYTQTLEFKTLNFEYKTPNPEPRTPNFIIEFPLSTIRIGHFNLPLSGGGYFRLLPYFLVKRGLKSINQVEGQPFIFYLHPWEVDPAQPRIKAAGLKSRFRHYLNLNKTEGRLKQLLMDFDFSPLKDLFRILMGS